MIRLVDSSLMRSASSLSPTLAKDKLSQEEQDRIFSRLPDIFWVKEISVSKHRCKQLAGIWEKEGRIKRYWIHGGIKVRYQKVKDA
jgi:hypothetical protein